MARSGYFFGALFLHVLIFLMVATVVIWKSQAPVQEEFHAVSVKVALPPPPPPPPTPPSAGAAANTPTEPTPVTAPVVTPPSVITTASSSFQVDTTKILDQAMNHMSDRVAQGAGLSDGGGGGGGGGGNGFFGSDSGTTTGMIGNFYDFTRTQGGSETKLNEKGYANAIRAFTRIWGPPDEFPHYKSDVTLASKFFFFPPIPDHLAGAAFKTPSSTEAFWIAHYHGSFTPDQDGDFYPVGFGDNLMAVRINSETVLDASDKGYLGIPRKKAGIEVKPGTSGVLMPGKGPATPLFEGKLIQFQAGQTVHMDVTVGDEGGIFCAGLFLRPKGVELSYAPNGAPKIPLMVIGKMSDYDVIALKKFLPPECLTSPINFTGVEEAQPGP